jgi:hypothetical protein
MASNYTIPMNQKRVHSNELPCSFSQDQEGDPEKEGKISSGASTSDPKDALPQEQEADGTVYPPFRTVALVMFALYIAMFLVALVSSIFLERNVADISRIAS